MIHESTKQFEKAMTFAGLTNCPQDGRWLIPTDSDICTEIETIALVFGFVRALRPKVVVETGCNVGCMAQAICEALTANGSGMLFTCDIEPKFVEATRRRGLANCTAMELSGSELVSLYPDADLYFIDSSDESRMRELEWLRLYGKPETVVLVHDTNLYAHVADVVRRFPQHAFLPGPRGLGVIRL